MNDNDRIIELLGEISSLRKQCEEAKLKHEKLKRFLSELKANIDGAIDHV